MNKVMKEYLEERLEKLLRSHRAHVFDEVGGERHVRMVERLKRTKTFKDACARRRAAAGYRREAALDRQG
jgi:hypothetical protein